MERDSKENNRLALNRLDQYAKEGEKPIVFWIGAGASAWCGYDLWSTIADHMHTRFSRTVKKYEGELANQLISENKYPEYFELCKEVDAELYHSTLLVLLARRPVSDLYDRFLKALEPGPIRILTTNVDSLLDENIEANLIGRTDLERVSEALSSNKSFICKLHGTLSTLESIVFTASDYRDLVEE